MARYHGRHRRPSRLEVRTSEFGATTGRVLAGTVAATAVVATPLVLAGPAQAASYATWDKLAKCESGGRWNINTGNGYHGGLQFSPSTWRAYGGTAYAPTANKASREQQIAVAEKVLAKQGWRAWPSCSRKLGLKEGPTARSAPKATPKPSGQQAPAPTRQRLNGPIGSPGGTYVVQPGDTLAKIAQQHRVSEGWRGLVGKNPSLATNPHLLQPGQRIDL